ncbi:hypothetical protein CBR_g3949 [Chara braunii]|uniref:Uncharacterized protein n=1 Tax=Chara braunii TaxID=69332 RepID=A0A388KGT4_CHABU|nr:hypothetical protein CBR_g3949 [Chara braunii]|eukprot:GBG69251.1 hypothetical protein CBR_g3949 [Chara braunii]
MHPLQPTIASPTCRQRHYNASIHVSCSVVLKALQTWPRIFFKKSSRSFLFKTSSSKHSIDRALARQAARVAGLPVLAGGIAVLAGVAGVAAGVVAGVAAGVAAGIAAGIAAGVAAGVGFISSRDQRHGKLQDLQDLQHLQEFQEEFQEELQQELQPELAS